MKIIDRLLKEKIIAVLRADDQDAGYHMAKAIFRGGIKAIEVTFTIPKAEMLISRLKEAFGDQGIIGAGTVLDLQTCKKAISHGAQYIVSPGFDLACATYCYENKIPYLPGSMTITEIMHAQAHHVKVIKLFPGEHFGPSFIKSIKAPLPHLKVMVTGGVDLNNIEAWFKAGADMVGIGSALTKDKDDKKITDMSKAYIEKVKAVSP